MLQAVVRDAQGVHVIEPTPDNLRQSMAGTGTVLWVDYERASTEEIATLSTVFGFHPLAIEDCVGHVEHPKLDDYGSYFYIVAHSFRCLDGSDELETCELDLFLGPNYVVTYQHEPMACLTSLWQRAQRDERIMGRGADGVAHAILDAIVDDLMPVLDRLDATIEDLEDDILAKPHRRTLARILDIKRATLHLRRTLVPQREVIYRLSRDDSTLVQARIRPYFRDVYDHLVRVVDINESLRDLVSGALEIYLSVMSNRTNDVMKVLTLFTAIFMPLGLVAGFFGMNFRFLPGLESPIGVLAVVAGMTSIAGCMLYWFRRRGWM